jgi:hypothetical protein
MRRNNIFIIQWIAWLCVTLTACSGIEDELSSATQANDSGSETRANLVEYTIDVETAGTLGSLVESRGYSDAQKLIVTGKIGYKDVNYVDVNMQTVEVLDLTEATYESDLIYGAFLSDSTKIKEISLPKNITSISYRYDWGTSYFPFKCSSLTSIHIPEGVTSIGWYAFYNCSSLTSINIPESVTSIGWSAFSGCSSLTSITIPESVTSIGLYAFSNCSSLTSITIPEGVTIIGDNAFYNCSSLTSISIPEGVTSIENYTFEDCSSLTSITIPEGVTSIGWYAFYNCSSLTSITIPESVTSIGNYAFESCSSLRIIKWNNSRSITDYFSLLGKLIIYETKDSTSTEGYDITTAKQVIYTKNFSSKYGDEWYTISLPFKPTQITHEKKGTIAPFDSNIEGAKNFWLRELTPDGYQDVTEIEANHAYIIAMPNSYKYADKFNLDGTVTFSAENVTLTWEPVVAVGPTYSMYPTYNTVKKSMDVYAMNSEYSVDGYNRGHVWVRGAMDVAPFEAYVKLNEEAATMRSVLPMADGKRTAVRGASSSSDASTRGFYGQRKPRKEDM